MAAHTAEIITADKQTLLNVNMSNVTKLTTSNYLMWSLQVHALLDGYNLAGYLDGTTPPPPDTIITDGVPAPNPALAIWKRQDKLIFSGLLGAITMTIQPILSRSASAADIWRTLAATYANPSRGHLQQIRLQLKQWEKGTKTIDEFIQGLTTKIDQLALFGKPMDLEDQIAKVIEGLPEDYKSVADQIEGRDVAPTFTEVHEKLLNHEVKLLANSTAAAIISTPVTANTANTRGRGYQGRSSTQHWNQNKGSDHYSASRQDQCGGRGYQGKCQLCGTHGHSARRCYQLLNRQLTPNNQVSTPTFPPWQPKANIATGTAQTDNMWLMDSGATHHMTSDLHNLSLHNPYHGNDLVQIGDGSGLSITHTGSVSLSSPSRAFRLTDVLCVPNIHKNLISVYRLCNANKVSVEFFQVKDLSSGVPLLQGKTRGELYEWPFSPSTLTSFFANTSTKISPKEWHDRLGHPAVPVLKSIISSFQLPCSQVVSQTLSCSDCSINKSHKLPFFQTSITSNRPLEYLFADVWTSPVVSVDNFKYYLVIVDHYTRYSWLYAMKNKSDVRDIFIPFKSLVENKFNTRIGTFFFSDNGGEFLALRSFLATAGISHLTSPPHTPEHNGLSERKHRHVVETGLSLLTHAGMPSSYWTYAFATAIYLINRLPTPVLNMTSPFHKLFGEIPNYGKLRTFGSLCFPWL